MKNGGGALVYKIIILIIKIDLGGKIWKID